MYQQLIHNYKIIMITEQDKNETNKETFRHILTLRSLLSQCCLELLNRGNKHDLSKLSEPEVDLFTEYTPKLKHMEYGSEEYKECLQNLKPALDNHYKENNHHPEHYENGIIDMDVLAILEMLCDWKASSLRGKNGDLLKSLEIQKDRFNIDTQLYHILKNTIPIIEQMSKDANLYISYK